jgi:hypothetical protein
VGVTTRSWHRWVLGALVAAGLVAVVLHIGEWRNFAALVERMRPGWLAAAILLQISTYFSLASSWRAVLTAGDGREFEMMALLRIALCKILADQAVPTACVSGNVLLIERLRSIGASRGTAMAVLLVSIRGYYAAYLAFALASMLLLWSRGEASPLLVGLVTTFILVALAIPALALWLRRRGSRPLPPWLERLGPIRQLLETMAAAPPSCSLPTR